MLDCTYRVEVLYFSSAEARQSLIDEGNRYCKILLLSSILTLAEMSHKYESLIMEVKERNHLGILLYTDAEQNLKSKALVKARWNDIVGPEH